MASSRLPASPWDRNSGAVARWRTSIAGIVIEAVTELHVCDDLVGLTNNQSIQRFVTWLANRVLELDGCRIVEDRLEEPENRRMIGFGGGG